MTELVVIVVAGTLAILGVRHALRPLFRRVVIHDYEAGLLYRNGRFVRRLGAGSHLLLAPRREIRVLDLRRHFATVAGQEVLSLDHVGLKVSLAVSYEVAEPEAAAHRVRDHEEALHVLVQLALRAAVAAVRIEDLLAQRTELGRKLQAAVAPDAEAIGLRVHAVEVKDVMFPGELKKIFAEVVRAQKEGHAALERARGETAALRSLANAARLVQDSPALLELRALQSVAVAAANGGSVVLGVPQATVAAARSARAKRDDEG
ncbi:MAG TPA: slipin family protein [Anaeromyxobacter sp.]|nr:slipin family protein [Anaeromyxobacter sp.]